MPNKTDSTVQGAASGAAIGTAFGGPGIGTAIGAGIGGLGGYLMGGGPSRMDNANAQYGTGGTPGDWGVPGFDAMNNGYREQASDRRALAEGYGARDAYVSDQRKGQLGLGNMLLKEAQGNGVGQNLVRMQAREAANRASAQQFAALGGARPGMQAMAARNAMLGTALAQGGVGQQAAMGSAQMTLGAQQQYGQHLQGVRGQDETNQMNQRALNDRSQLDAYGQQMQLMQQRQNLAGMAQQGNQAYQQNQTNRWNTSMGQPTDREVTMGAITGLGGGLMAYGNGGGMFGGGNQQQQKPQYNGWGGAYNGTPNQQTNDRGFTNYGPSYAPNIMPGNNR